MKGFISYLFRWLAVLFGIFFCMIGVLTIMHLENGNLVWKETQQPLPVSSAVTQADLNALMESVNRRDAAQDIIIMGLVNRMDVKQGVRK